MKLGMQVGLGPGHIVLDGHPAPLSKWAERPPNFLPISVAANGCMEIKMSLGMELGLSPGDFV